MVSDSISTAPIPSAATTKNLGKKKRTNRAAKLKQCKIDARREQWLSQGGVVKNNGADVAHGGKGSKGLSEKLEMRTRGDEEEEDEGFVHHDSDYSPTSVNSCNDSGTNFTGSSSSGGSGSSSSSTSSAGCCSGYITEEEENDDDEDDDDGCLDDWEAVADALAADDKCQNHYLESLPVDEPIVQVVSPCEVTNGSNWGPQNSKPDSARLVSWTSGNGQAWRPDDAFRPQNLPNLSKQLSLPNPGRRCGGGVPWACTAVPSLCPICCEDLDLTDSNFMPCLCGFRLCLFCHKRILEDDGRCPGCRKQYECEPIETEASLHGGSLTLQLARSCSMIERS